MHNRNVLLSSVMLILTIGLLALNPSIGTEVQTQSSEDNYNDNYYRDDKRYGYDNDDREYGFEEYKNDIVASALTDNDIEPNTADIGNIQERILEYLTKELNELCSALEPYISNPNINLFSFCEEGEIGGVLIPEY